MVIVRKFGKLDIFITFICNPLQSKTVNSNHSDETANNRPDIVDLVRNAKVKELINLITTRKIFREIQTFLCTVKFQKKGLPINLTRALQAEEIETINNVASAEIPNPNNTMLLNLMKSHLIPRPCVD